MKALPVLHIVGLCLVLIFACQKRKAFNDTLLRAHLLLELYPDSAAGLLSQLTPEIRNLTEGERAFYCLLQTQANVRGNASCNLDSAIDVAVDYYQKTQDSRNLARAYFYKGVLHSASQSDSSAMLYYIKAKHEAEKSRDNLLLMKISNNLSLIYLFQNLPDYSLQELDDAQLFMEKASCRSRYQATLLRNRARAYNLKNILIPGRDSLCVDTAIQIYNQALASVTDSTSKDLVRSVYKELSTIYSYKNDFQKAFDYLNASIDSSDLMLYYNSKADIFMNMNQADSAFLYLQKCISDPRLYIKCTTYDKLYQIEKKKGNVLKALEYADSLLALNDSLIAITIPDKVVEIQRKYNNEKLRAEKAYLEISYEKEKSRSLIVSFAVLVLLFIGTYIYIYSYLKKKKLQQSLLEHKNELLLLKQKIQQWDQQVKIGQEIINRLEKEKKKVQGDLNLVTKEKEIILKEKEEELAHYHQQENDILMQRAKYEELCFVEFKKLFLSTPLARRIPAFDSEKIVTDRLSSNMQRQLMNVMDEVCCNFASRLYALLQESTEKTCLCCLIKLQVKTKYILILCDLSKEAYYKQCQRMAEHLTGKSSVSSLKEYLNSF